MELKDQVCSLELAKKLKELGEPQDSLWWWVDFHQGYAKGHCDYDEMLRWEIGDKNRAIHFSNAISAPTVAELGERLPIGCKSWLMHGEPIYVNGDHITGHWTGRYKRGKWICTYREKKYEAKTEADVRTKMRIYLLENKLIEEG